MCPRFTKKIYLLRKKIIQIFPVILCLRYYFCYVWKSLSTHIQNPNPIKIIRIFRAFFSSVSCFLTNLVNYTLKKNKQFSAAIYPTTLRLTEETIYEKKY